MLCNKLCDKGILIKDVVLGCLNDEEDAKRERLLQLGAAIGSVGCSKTAA